MQEPDIVIRGGTVVSATDTMLCDVAIRDGVVVALGKDIAGGARVIDASGLIVMPGGVDSHCHIEQFRRDSPYLPADDFETGTTAAAFGGTTSIICFVPHDKGTPLTPAVDAYHKRAGKSVVDYGLHVMVADASVEVLAELPGIIAAGHRSLKVFMTYEPSRLDDAQMLAVLAVARENEALVTVHAENHDALGWMTKRLEAAGKGAAPYHAISRPPLIEAEAVHRAIALAELVDQPIQIFHVTSIEALDEVRRARARGLKVFAETCTHYLTVDSSALARDGVEGAKVICSPALRGARDQDALWQGIREGVIGVVSSDHSPINIHGANGKMSLGDNLPFWKINNGMPGIETRLPVLFSEGVVKGRIDLQQFVAISATNPAKLFGLHPRKGSIAIGMDADLAIWDPRLTRRITNSALHHAVDYTPFEGMEVTGWPVATLVRGVPVVENGKRHVDPGFGRFLAREPYPFIRPRNVFPTAFDPFSG